MKKRGQVTIFIILAVVIVAMVALIYLFSPEIKGVLGIEPQSPSEIIQSCLAEGLEESIATISFQGGSLTPEHYVLKNGEKIEYLCYAEEYYQTCVIQQPMLKRHVEEEIADVLKTPSKECFQELEDTYRRQGYDVDLKYGDVKVDLLPKNIVITFNNRLAVTKGETQVYPSTKIILNNNLYELISVANSILGWETTYGDAETTTYMDYYHDMKVEKEKQSDGTTIYTLTNRDTENKFQFASRSVAWPPGFGLNEVTYTQ